VPLDGYCLGVKSKDHVIRLARLEGELRSTPDAELASLVKAATPEVQEYLASIAAPGEDDDIVSVASLRGAMSRGRMKGLPDRIMATLTEPCLDACITALGEKADFPSEADLMAVTPSLVTSWGRCTTRLMLASAALSEAPAGATIMKVLRNDPTLAAPITPTAPAAPTDLVTPDSV
jgi:hypothetical protein